MLSIDIYEQQFYMTNKCNIFKIKTPKKPHQKEPNPAKNSPLLNSLFIELND